MQWLSTSSRSVQTTPFVCAIPKCPLQWIAECRSAIRLVSHRQQALVLDVRACCNRSRLRSEMPIIERYVERARPRTFTAFVQVAIVPSMLIFPTSRSLVGTPPDVVPPIT